MRIRAHALRRLLAAGAILAARPAIASPPLRTVVYGPATAQVASLCVPEHVTQRAAALLIHGGGWSAGSREEFAGLAQWFCDNGAVAMTMGYRLAPVPRTPGDAAADAAGPSVPGARAAGTAAGERARWPAQLDDARQAVWWLREHAAALHFDPGRVLAVGGSAGALLAGWLGTSDQVDDLGTHSRVAAVVSLWGPWDLTAPTPREDARNMVAALLGSRPARSASPIFQVDGRSAPTLFVHGTADTLVPPEQSRRACAALRASAVRCEVLLLEGEGHGPARTDAGWLVGRIAAFATATLPPVSP